MDYIVLDLEWNQAVDGKEGENEKIPFEIIEIGAIKLNSDFEEVSRFSQVIKPEVYPKMHHVMKQLVHIDKDELMQGKPFRDVAASFIEWCGNDYIFCTWGQLDLMEFQRNMEYYEMPPLCAGPLRFYDVQKLFSLAYDDGKSRFALETAVDHLKVEKGADFHRAFSDAYYTAQIFSLLRKPEIMERVSFDLYHLPKSRKDEVYIVFSDYAKFISREFADKAEAMEDKQVSSMKCYLCNKNIRRKIKWFTPNGKHYYGVAACDVHGLIKYKIRMKKSREEKVYVIKTSKQTDEDGLLRVKEKKEKARILRQQKRHMKADKSKQI